jgi:HEAT repeat protein
VSSEELQRLFGRTLSGEYDDDQPWEAVRELHRLGTRDVFEIAAEWCRSADPLMRARGVNVIAQLGKTVEHPSNNFPQDAFFVIEELVRTETKIRPLSSGIFALGYLENSHAIQPVCRHQGHSSAEVREAVAFALGQYPNDTQSIAGLIALTADSCPDVRDWASFGLGVLGDADTPEIRGALAARLSDTNQDAREEALVGLAKRQDQQALPSLMELLKGPAPSSRVMEAAAFMLGTEQEEPEPSHYIQMLNERFL